MLLLLMIIINKKDSQFFILRNHLKTIKTKKHTPPVVSILSCPTDQRCDWLFLVCPRLIRGGRGTLQPYSRTQSQYTERRQLVAYEHD